MARAIIEGLLRQGYPANQLMVTDPNEHKLAFFSLLGTYTSKDNFSAVKRAEVIILAVKPQAIADVCRALSAVNFNHKLVISIAAGVSTARLFSLLPSATSVIRAMPNTPALIAEGITGLFAAENLPKNDRAFAEYLLSTVGETVWLNDERQMHAVTAASGSSPAYFYYMLEAMQQALLEMGLDEQNARKFIQQAMLGTAKMAIENMTIPFSELRENVTSKGGTTEKALAVMKERHFNDIIYRALFACANRSEEMEKSF